MGVSLWVDSLCGICTGCIIPVHYIRWKTLQSYLKNLNYTLILFDLYRYMLETQELSFVAVWQVP